MMIVPSPAISAQMAEVMNATGATARQLISWRAAGWLHSPTFGSGHPYPWGKELRQIDWLARLARSRSGSPPRECIANGLDRLDAEGGYQLRVGGATWGIRIGRGPWRPAQPGDLAVCVEHGEPFTIAVVVRPEIEALAEQVAA